MSTEPDVILQIAEKDLQRLYAEAAHSITECRRLHRLLHNVGACPACSATDVAIGLTGAPHPEGMTFQCETCGFQARSRRWPPHPAYATVLQLGIKVPTL